MEKPAKRVIPADSIWSPNLIALAIAIFFISFGTGLNSAASTNFFVKVLGLSGSQVLWLAGIREVPGLLLMFIAAVIMHWRLKNRATVAVATMGIGYALYGLVNSYLALIIVALIGSLGFHVWMPLNSSLALGLARKEHSGKVMGSLAAVTALATIVGMGAVAILSPVLPLRLFNVLGGVFMIVAAFLLFRLPQDVGSVAGPQPRMLIHRRYWLYYVLTFFEGSRTQVFHAFGTLVLVQYYGWDARQISLLLLASAAVNFAFARRLGRYLDIIGERWVLSASYVLLALCFVGYATMNNPYLLGLFLIGINLLVTLSIGLSTYVNRIAPREELTPTLSAGVSINHITSVAMSLVAGTLLTIVGYQALCWGAAAIILLSVPFSLSMRVFPQPVLQSSPAAAGE